MSLNNYAKWDKFAREAESDEEVPSKEDKQPSGLSITNSSAQALSARAKIAALKAKSLNKKGSGGSAAPDVVYKSAEATNQVQALAKYSSQIQREADELFQEQQLKEKLDSILSFAYNSMVSMVSDTFKEKINQYTESRGSTVRDSEGILLEKSLEKLGELDLSVRGVLSQLPDVMSEYNSHKIKLFLARFGLDKKVRSSCGHDHNSGEKCSHGGDSSLDFPKVTSMSWRNESALRALALREDILNARAVILLLRGAPVAAAESLRFQLSQRASTPTAWYLRAVAMRAAALEPHQSSLRSNITVPGAKGFLLLSQLHLDKAHTALVLLCRSAGSSAALRQPAPSIVPILQKVVLDAIRTVEIGNSVKFSLEAHTVLLDAVASALAEAYSHRFFRVRAELPDHVLDSLLHEDSRFRAMSGSLIAAFDSFLLTYFSSDPEKPSTLSVEVLEKLSAAFEGYLRGGNFRLLKPEEAESVLLSRPEMEWAVWKIRDVLPKTFRGKIGKIDISDEKTLKEEVKLKSSSQHLDDFEMEKMASRSTLASVFEQQLHEFNDPRVLRDDWEVMSGWNLSGGSCHASAGSCSHRSHKHDENPFVSKVFEPRSLQAVLVRFKLELLSLTHSASELELPILSYLNLVEMENVGGKESSIQASLLSSEGFSASAACAHGVQAIYLLLRHYSFIRSEEDFFNISHVRCYSDVLQHFLGTSWNGAAGIDGIDALLGPHGSLKDADGVAIVLALILQLSSHSGGASGCDTSSYPFLRALAHCLELAGVLRLRLTRSSTRAALSLAEAISSVSTVLLCSTAGFIVHGEVNDDDDKQEQRESARERLIWALKARSLGIAIEAAETAATSGRSPFVDVVSRTVSSASPISMHFRVREHLESLQTLLTGKNLRCPCDSIKDLIQDENTWRLFNGFVGITGKEMMLFELSAIFQLRITYDSEGSISFSSHCTDCWDISRITNKLKNDSRLQ